MPEATQDDPALTPNGSDPAPATAPTVAVAARARQNGGANGHGRAANAALPASSSAAAVDTAAQAPPARPSPDRTAGGGGAGADTSPKKRRKVNHACVYCRRSHMTCDLERPCTRCVKRNIGPLCHDEPRDHVKKSRSEPEQSAGEDAGPSSRPARTPPAAEGMPPTPPEPRADQQRMREAGRVSSLPPPPAPPPTAADAAAATAVARPMPISGAQARAAVAAGDPHLLGYPDWSLGGQSQFQDMHTFHPSYMFNAPEVTNEYNLLNDFLSTSLIDDGALYPAEDGPAFYPDASPLTSAMPPNRPGRDVSLPPGQPSHVAPSSQALAVQAPAISRPASTVPSDKARETYYMTAADPSGSDPPEERMNKLLRAKYDAGLLKPFNYVKGYARLSHYMEKNMQPASRQKILRQLDQFRPKFRERMEKLTDIELVLVEMWFERSLMEYDRVFASMAIPACCWRRTGEIFRGNNEMAELVHVPIEKLRDGKVAIHEILENESIVSYWEKFGTIAFDNAQKAMLTSCYLKNPDPKSHDASIHCCFSFTIRRDSHNIPSIIVGNFLPMDPIKR